MKLSATLCRWLAGGLSLLAPAAAFSQALAPTLLDDFNRPDSPTVGTGWVETETMAGTGAALAGH